MNMCRHVGLISTRRARVESRRGSHTAAGRRALFLDAPRATVFNTGQFKREVSDSCAVLGAIQLTSTKCLGSLEGSLKLSTAQSSYQHGF
jgi:hypothetical protein